MTTVLLALFACVGKGAPDDTVTPDDSADTDTETSDDSSPDSTGSDSGEDSAPRDADGDGYPAAEDCDDDDPRQYPGAPELCDAVDQDCDGEPLAEGVCGEPQAAASVSSVLTSSDGAIVMGDLTGDGSPDLLTPVIDAPSPTGGAAFGFILYEGGWSVPDPPFAPPAGAVHSWVLGDGVCDTDSDPLFPGDLDGDGYEDLAFVDHVCTYGLYVHAGPFATDGTAEWMGDTELVWTAPIGELGSWMYAVAAGGDFDGDGRNDIAGSDGSDDDFPDPALFNVFYGGTWGETQVRVSSEGIRSSGYLDLLEDIDGDGLDDLHVIAEEDDGSHHLLLSGGDLATADGQAAQDMALGRWPARDGTSIGVTGCTGCVITAGDWTGDGTNDLFVTARGSYTLGYTHGEVFVVEGTTRGEFTVGDVAVGSWVGNIEDGDTWLEEAIDADGEPGLELIIADGSGYAPFGGGHWIVPHELPALRTPISGVKLSGSIIDRGPPQDFDGDGYEDWAFGDGDAGTGNLWFGWDIPWDDPTYW